MKGEKKLEHIANGFYAAAEIRNMYNTRLHENADTSVRASSISMMDQIFDILTRYSPQRDREPLEKTARQSSIYIDTYRNLKQQLKSPETRKVNKDNFVNTLSLMKPVLSNRDKTLVDKILKLYEIFS